MVCSTDERIGNFPFDIQHKHIVTYKTSSISDYDALAKSITEKLTALIGKQKIVKKIIENPVKESEGLKQHEVTMLLMIIENQLTDEDTVSVYNVKTDMDKAGFNSIAVSISLRELKRKGLIDTFKEYGDFNNQEYLACKLTEKGEEWILGNQDKIEFRKQPKNSTDDTVQDLPF